MVVVLLTLLGADDAAVVRLFSVSVLTALLALAGVTADMREADVLPDVLDAEVSLSACVLDADTVVAALPDLLVVAMPPLVETLLVNVLSAPVLCLEPCQLSSLTGPTCM